MARGSKTGKLVRWKVLSGKDFRRKTRGFFLLD